MADRVEAVTPEPKTTEQAPSHVTDASDGSTQRVIVDPSKAPEQTPQNNGESLLAGKFKTPADLEKAYKELESRLGQPQDKPKDGSEAQKDSTTKTPDAKAVVEKAGLNMAELNREFAETGDLSEESLAKLNAAGIDKAQVDAFIAGQKALVQQYEEGLAKVVGGTEKLQQLLQWAGSNLTEAEINATNEALVSMDAVKGKIALESLQARYSRTMGTDPKLVNGESVPSRSGPEPFGSMQEMADAMANPKYRTDPAYQAKVEARVAATSAFTHRSI